MRNGNSRGGSVWKNAPAEIKADATTGWQDAAAGRGFPADFDAWPRYRQVNYEMARHMYFEANAGRKRALAIRTVYTRTAALAPATLELNRRG